MSASKTRLKSAAATYPIPTSMHAANRQLAAIGALAREIKAATSRADGAIADARADLARTIEPLQAEADQLTRGLQHWAEGLRPMLTDDGRHKTIKLLAGRFGWRLRPPSVTLRDMPHVIAQCVTRGLMGFVRTKHEVDRAAMLAEPALAGTIEGVKIASAGEEFFVEPTEIAATEIGAAEHDA